MLNGAYWVLLPLCATAVGVTLLTAIARSRATPHVLPVVAAFQVWVGHWPLHWSVKYPFILVASFAVLFLSYHYLVRPTFIGKLLNGRRYPRKPGAVPGELAVTRAQAPRDDQAVAELRGVVKKYGANTALAGIDVERDFFQHLA